MSDVAQGKTAAIVSYLTPIGTVAALIMNNEKKNPFAAFHVRQALGLFLTQFAFGFLVSSLDSWTATKTFYAILFILWLIGFSGAVQGVARKMPLLGDVYQKLFKSIP